MIVPGFSRSTPRPPKPKYRLLPETGVMSVQTPEVMLYLKTEPVVPS